ncbi:hypothetical protein A6768_05510 [Sphingobium yanoikuyae]|uniref:Uncharacterized protein n=1 Tax=Sphingobium yanoikuyae TaxID=13690 RepID=A0A291MX97_SPHYA|nr:hypothetical protein A6768_05510 [Sphingobium yanoikuyae]
MMPFWKTIKAAHVAFDAVMRNSSLIIDARVAASSLKMTIWSNPSICRFGDTRMLTSRLIGRKL